MKNVALLALGIVGSIFVVYFLIAFSYVAGSKDSNIGMFGDAFGMLNALFSGGALIAVATTLFLQIKELRLQREEFAKMVEVQEQANEIERESVQGDFILKDNFVFLIGSALGDSKPSPLVINEVYSALTLGLENPSPACRQLEVSLHFGDVAQILFETSILRPGSSVDLDAQMFKFQDSGDELMELRIDYVTVVGQYRTHSIYFDYRDWESDSNLVNPQDLIGRARHIFVHRQEDSCNHEGYPASAKSALHQLL